MDGQLVRYLDRYLSPSVIWGYLLLVAITLAGGVFLTVFGYTNIGTDADPVGTPIWVVVPAVCGVFGVSLVFLLIARWRVKSTLDPDISARYLALGRIAGPGLAGSQEPIRQLSTLFSWPRFWRARRS